MKWLVISDTHMPKRAKQFPDTLEDELKKVNHIIHAGDFQTMDVYEKLSQYGKLHGVYGNIDEEDLKEQLPAKKTLEIEGFRIGLVHGHGEKKTTEKRVLEAFDEKMDIIIFGHSHMPLLRYVGKTLLFNPGSVTDKRKLPYYSFGRLHIGEELQAEHVFFNR
ncbi:metallophosphoesterase family protein [Salsuginibacillus kocurii]|uniref:metallophosphoesterase family protein n=1 Tax=Salsuginibacillus kocurii TaxID=427078 RepID=UPI00037FB081|nr:metallophosphoesterase family protein [Salsuginibacillus kocurii]